MTWEFYEIQILVPTNKVWLEHSHAHSFRYYLWPLYSTASEMGGYEKAWNTICLFTEKICWSNSWTRRRTLGFHLLNLYQMVILYMVIQSSFSFRKSQFSGNTSHIIALVRFDCEFWIYLLYNGNQFFFPKGIISLSSSAFIRALKESL